MPLKRSKPTLAQCKATTSSGDRCKAKPHKDGLCFFHSDPKKAAELGRKGGRRNRHAYETPLQHYLRVGSKPSYRISRKMRWCSATMRSLACRSGSSDHTP